ncbi:MAG: hypothetical protein ABIF77_07475, partial [bacterium]
RLALIPIEGGEPEFPDVPAACRFLCWNPTSTGLTCMSREAGRLVVWDVPLAPATPRRLMDFAAEQANITDAAWNPSGDTLAFCLQFTTYDALLLQRSVARN